MQSEERFHICDSGRGSEVAKRRSSSFETQSYRKFFNFNVSGIKSVCGSAWFARAEWWPDRGAVFEPVMLPQSRWNTRQIFLQPGVWWATGLPRASRMTLPGYLTWLLRKGHPGTWKTRQLRDFRGHIRATSRIWFHKLGLLCHTWLRQMEVEVGVGTGMVVWQQELCHTFPGIQADLADRWCRWCSSMSCHRFANLTGYQELLLHQQL